MRSRSSSVALLAPFILVSCNCDESQGFTRVEPKIVVSPESLEFGEVPTGATRILRLVVENTGTSELDISGVDVTGPFSTRFAPTAIATGSRLEIDVAFSPVNVDPATGMLGIASSDPQSPMVVVPLSGKGGVGMIASQPARVDFKDTVVGVSRRAEIVFLNLGIAEVSGRLRTDGFPRPEHYALTTLTRFDDVVPFTVGARSEIELDLDYRPIALGSDSGRILFEYCGPRCGLSVDVDASAIQAVVRLEPPLVDFGTVGIGLSSSRTVTVHNDGTLPVDVLSLSTAGGAEFVAASTRQLPVTLGPNSSMAINVEYRPAAATTFSGELRVRTSDPAVPVASVRVTGKGEGPLFLVQPEAISFGLERVAATHQRSLLLINAGSADVRVQAVTVSGRGFALGQIPGLPATLRSGESLSARVTFTPDVLGAYTGAVEVVTDDPLHPMVTVLVSGGLVDRLCELGFSSERVNFGLLPLGFSRSKSVTLTNVGTDICTLDSGTFREPLDPAITLTAGTFPVTLSPGQNTALSFSYSPAAMIESKGTFVMRTTDVAFPERHLAVAGSAAGYIDILADPTMVDFGQLSPGCVSSPREVRILNVGTAPALIDGITLSSPTTELRLVPPATPFTLSPGAEEVMHAQYAPRSVGRDEGLVEITIHDYPYPIVVPLSGLGATDPRISETFRQTTERKVDVLFVVDNSCSMSDEQNAIAQNFRSFIQHANVRNIEFQIGVTTTTVFPLPGALVGPILSNSTSDLERKFQMQVNVGVMGSGIEQGLEAMHGALGLAMRGVSPNARLLRPDASLFTVILSDEDDQSSLSPAFYANALRSFAPRGYLAATVTGQSAGCGPQNGGMLGLGAVSAPRYEQFVALSSGLSESICADWSSTLNALGAAAFGLVRDFRLGNVLDTRKPVTVTVNGRTLSSSEWTYDAQSNALSLTTAPPEGATIVIEYSPRC